MQETNNTSKYDPQIKNHKSRHSEEDIVIFDGAALCGGSSKWQHPRVRNSRDFFFFLTMVNNSPEGKAASFQINLLNL